MISKIWPDWGWESAGKDEEIKELKYELVDPIVNILNEIEDLRDLVVAVDNEYSEQQLVKFVCKSSRT